MLSPHPADPTLITDNLMEVVKEVEHHWKDLGDKLGLRGHLVGTEWQLSGVHGMADVVDEYVRRYPTPSWKQVATVLQEMEIDKLADEVTTKYVRGMDVNHVTCLIHKLKLGVLLMRELRFGQHACLVLTWCVCMVRYWLLGTRLVYMCCEYLEFMRWRSGLL